MELEGGMFGPERGAELTPLCLLHGPWGTLSGSKERIEIIQKRWDRQEARVEEMEKAGSQSRDLGTSPHATSSPLIDVRGAPIADATQRHLGMLSGYH